MGTSACTRLERALQGCLVPHDRDGCLVVLEGAPGAGKTTFLHRSSGLGGVSTFPQLDHTTQTPLVPDNDALDWYVTEELNRCRHVRAALSASSHYVIQDRCVLSVLAFAYAAARRYGHDGRFASALRKVLQRTRGRLLQPDILFVLTVAPHVGLQRRYTLAGPPSHEEWRDTTFLRHHASFYTEFLPTFPARRVHVIDTTELTVGATTDAIMAAVAGFRRS